MSRFLADPGRYNTEPRRGRPRKKTVRNVRRVALKASQDVSSAPDIKNELSLNLSVSLAPHLFHHNVDLRYKKVHFAPPLTAKHKMDLIEWVGNHVKWTNQD